MQVLAHNLASQFTNRQLNITTDKRAKSSEKLSSGYKINRSADDAAGLQISEKMRWQIRGLDQASENIQDGISLCQVADGALNESHAVLQRMRELSVQAANDTNSDEDRNAIQEEIEQLTNEIDRIANSTSFNEDIYPLKGGHYVNGIKNITTTKTLVSTSYPLKLSGADEPVGSRFREGFGKTYSFSQITSIGADYEFVDNNNVFTLTIPYKIVTDANGDTIKNKNPLNLDGTYTKRNTGGSLGTYPSIYVHYTSSIIMQLENNSTYNDVINYFSNLSIYVNDNGTMIPSNDSLTKTETSNVPYTYWDNGELWIQMGAQAGQGMSLSIVDATAKGVGITDPALDVTDFNSASTSIARLDDAISKVSSYRSSFGAQQNRLEYGKKVDDNTAENTQKAESLIRDTDMAEELVNYSKNNILEQAGQVLLAQANQSMQGILQLLQ